MARKIAVNRKCLYFDSDFPGVKSLTIQMTLIKAALIYHISVHTTSHYWTADDPSHWPPFYEYMYMTGLHMKHLVYMPIRHMVLKMYVPCKNFHMPTQYLYKPCKAYINGLMSERLNSSVLAMELLLRLSCTKPSMYTARKISTCRPRLKNPLPSQAHNYKCLCALRQDLHAMGMRAHLNVEPCII